MSPLKLSPGGIATMACMLEVAAPKPGNVHRSADFEDVTFVDFATSAVALGNTIDQWVGMPLGQTIFQAVEQTRMVAGSNTNLGMILLIVPLAKIVESNPSASLTPDEVSVFLTRSTQQDGEDVFAAIKRAQPGGLGAVDEMDVQSNLGPVDLMQAMKLAAERDAIARQYATGFRDVFDIGMPLLQRGRQLFSELSQAIVFTHVALMANEPDSLIRRKLGEKAAAHSQMLAAKAADCIPQVDENRRPSESEAGSFWTAVGELDFWLRADGHRRNPGTTADLIAAILFVAIQNGVLHPPFQ